MNQMAVLNDRLFSELFDKYHNEDDNFLVCNNNIVTYFGETKTISGHYRILKNSSINLGNFYVADIDTQVWMLESHVLFFLISEFTKIRNGNYNFVYIFDYLTNIINKNQPTSEEITTIIRFVDYYNSLNIYKAYLRDDLEILFEEITRYISKTLNSFNNKPITPGYRYVYERLFKQVVSNTNQSVETDSSGMDQGKSRIRANGPRNVNFNPVPSDLSLTEFFTDPTSKAAFSNLLMIIFIIIITIAIVLTLIFL